MGEPRYRCTDCGIALNDGEGKAFAVCSTCWDRRYPPPPPSPSSLKAACPGCLTGPEYRPGGHKTTCASYQPPRTSPADRLKETITKWEARYAHYLVHAQKMLDMEDLHGLWDAAMNASEVSNRLDQLREDLAVIEGREP